MPSRHWNPITIQEGNLLRAFAILVILAHNYLHWVKDTLGENEFNYYNSRRETFLKELAENPADITRLLATLFGHYGVQIFLFLSGYGLAKKYQNTTPSYPTFLKQRLAALYPSILIASVAFIIYDSIRIGFTTLIQAEGLNLIRQITGIANFIPDNVYHPNGPWWFISVILQFYLIAPPLIRIAKKHPLTTSTTLIIFSISAEYLLAPTLQSSLNLNLNHTILGHLDLIGLGFLLAYHPPKKIPTTIILTALAITILGNFYGFLWPLTSLTSAVAAIPILRIIIKKIQPTSSTHKLLSLIGSLSLLMFLTNGYLRKPLIEFSKINPGWHLNILLTLIFITITLILSLLLQKILDQLQKPNR